MRAVEEGRWRPKMASHRPVRGTTGLTPEDLWAHGTHLWGLLWNARGGRTDPASHPDHGRHRESRPAGGRRNRRAPRGGRPDPEPPRAPAGCALGPRVAP